MTTNNSSKRAPGSFSAAVVTIPTTRSDISKAGSFSSSTEDLQSSRPQKPRLNTNVSRNNNYSAQGLVQPPRPLYASSQGNLSASSLQSFNFSRPTTHSNNVRAAETPPPRLTRQNNSQKMSNSEYHRHGRKHSSTQGSFEAYLPTAANNSLGNMTSLNTGLSASHITAQAVMQHQTHMRKRSQTVPSPQSENNSKQFPARGPSNAQVQAFLDSPAPYENGLGTQNYHNSLMRGAQGIVAHAAASIVFPNSTVTSPGLPPEYSTERENERENENEKEKPIRSEKSKVKLFSRPVKIGISKDKDTKAGLIPSPNMNNGIQNQRVNYNTGSITDSQSSSLSIYTLGNTSSATIRPVEAEEKKSEKEKHKHHFLSRQKHKLTNKEDHNLPLSSAASNSKPVDPSAPSSLYNFNTPLNTSVSSSSSSRSMSGLDLRHGARVLRDKKKDKDEKTEGTIKEGEISYQNLSSDKTGNYLTSYGATSFLAASSASYASSICGYDTPTEIAKNGLDRMGPDDAWPFLKTKLLSVFEGDDLRLPVEDLNQVVLLHIQASHRKRTQTKNLNDDLLDLLRNGFILLNQSLRFTPDKYFIPQLVEMWIFTFTVILPFMQAVFLPLDLEISKNTSKNQNSNGNQGDLNVRSMVLRSYRDIVILPRFEKLKDLFSRLHSEYPLTHLPDQSMLSPFSESSIGRPGTAMSLDPGIASYSSQTALLSDSFSPLNRGRTFSSVSNHAPNESPVTSGFGSFHLHDRSNEGSERLMARIIGRLLQCVGVLNSVHNGADNEAEGESIKEKMDELVRGLKLDLIERERIGRDKKNFVGARVRVPVLSFGAAIEA
ncbi:putative HbrB [Erysiphe necator]|uniref:Putative HbrB n=1 Tax=Uncinula necator TaxID=52586 RepID=A0A0B1PBF7_UNCNE|nr:putative HbrB [Erysiphe necator]